MAQMVSDSLCERLTVLEKLFNLCEQHGAEVDSLKRSRDPVEKMAEVECPRNSSEGNEEGLDARKKRKIASEENSERRNSLNDVETEHVEKLGVAQSVHPRACKTLLDMEFREQNLIREREAARKRKVDEALKALEERIRVVEDREREFNCSVEGKTRELELKEEELRLKLEDEKRHQLKDLDEIGEKLNSAENRLEGMRENFDKRLGEFECRENLVLEAAELWAKESDMIRESIDKKLEELEKRRSDFDSFKEQKMKELDAQGQMLNDREKAVMDAKLKNEELVREAHSIKECVQKEFEKFVNVKSEFNSFREKKMKELDSKEQLLNGMSEKAVKDAELRNEELIRQSTKKELEEFEKIKSDFKSFREKKMEDLYAKEQLLNELSEKIAKDTKSRNEKLIMHERSFCRLNKRLNLAKDDVEGLKAEVDQRFKTLASQERDVNSTRDWVEKRMDEADNKAKALQVKKKSIQLMEDKVNRKKYELREKEKELYSREKDLQAWQEKLELKQKEVDSAQESNEQLLEKLDAREKSMSELTGKCFKEHQAKKKELLLYKDLVEKVARFLGLEDENLKNAIRELESMEKQMTGHELISQPCADNSNGHVRKELDESADLKFTVRMDGKNLQMFLNDPEKDLVSMGDEIFNVLQLSSDPAKLVLDAMVGFYPPHLREEDTELEVRRTCILLLKQLTRMSRRIFKPCVREEAMQVALAWKSKMAENPSLLEALGFLLLLKAYDLASSFDNSEISSLLMMVSKHREETPDLDRVLDFTDTLAEINLESPKDNFANNISLPLWS